MIDPELLDVLVCPDCKSDVEFKDNKIVCKGCGRRYPVRDDIPVMLIEESDPPSSTDRQAREKRKNRDD